jgi:uncharacterized membrane protein YoaK (UPF0700 family)
MANLLAPRLFLRAALLCLIAGYVDIIGYIELGGVFAANMTGNSVLLVLAMARGEGFRVVSYVATLAAFLGGAIIASLLRRATRRPLLPLVAAAALVLLDALVSAPPLAQLVILATAMGLQGAAITRFGPTSLQTVVVTGTMIRLADNLAALAMPEERNEGTAGAGLLDALAWLAYIAGAALAIAARSVMTRPLILGAVALLVVAAESRNPDRSR